jgi:hypothetical protein
MHVMHNMIIQNKHGQALDYSFYELMENRCVCDDTKQCATLLGLQVQSVVARVIFPTKMTRG